MGWVGACWVSMASPRGSGRKDRQRLQQAGAQKWGRAGGGDEDASTEVQQQGPKTFQTASRSLRHSCNWPPDAGEWRAGSMDRSPSALPEPAHQGVTQPKPKPARPRSPRRRAFTIRKSRANRFSSSHLDG